MKGSEEEKAAAAKKFADINHGAALVLCGQRFMQHNQLHALEQVCCQHEMQQLHNCVFLQELTLMQVMQWSCIACALPLEAQSSALNTQ